MAKQTFKILCIILGFELCLLSDSSAFAQYENVWTFGTHAGLDFSNSAPVPIETSIEGWGEANASVCDSTGRLLFYTEGSYVWDHNGNLMPNGEDLTQTSNSSANNISSTSSASQGAIIVPHPGSGNLYYIFSVTSVEMPFSPRLYYSLVDMSLNGGKGDVVAGVKGIFIGDMLTEVITGVVGNRCNVWLISRSTARQEFRVYEISEDGIDTIPVISPSAGSGFGGRMIVSRDRKKLAVGTGGLHGLILYDFDPVSGIISNPLYLLPEQACIGVAFSADGTKLYSDCGETLYQFDISSGDPLVVTNSETQLTNEGDLLGGSLKLAVDNKIYFPSGQYISVINNPNLAGAASNVMLNMVPLMPGTYVRRGLTNVVPVIPRDTFLTGRQQSAGCFAAQTALTAVDTTTGWDYVWNTGTIGSQITVDTPGTYWVRYHTPPCNYHVDTFQVDFPNGVLPTIYTMAECRSDSNGNGYAYTYPDDPVTYRYTWMRDGDTLSVTDTLSDVPSGSYRLHVQTNTGCDTVLFFDIGEEDFRVSFTVSDTLICVGDAIELSNTSDVHFSTYHWAFGNGDTTDLPDPPVYVYPESGAYRLMLAGEGAICKDTAYQTILVDQPLMPAFEVEPQAVCVGQPVYFYPRTDSTTVQLSWEMEQQQRIEQNIQARYQHGFTSDGIFPVTLKVGLRACPDTSIMDSIRVYALPEVDLGSDSSLCLQGQPLYLRNLREAPLTTYHQVWSTGDTTEVLRVVHPGIYTLSVTMEPIGCTSTESITVNKDCYIDIPNAFTPDGDGNNDYFLPRTLLSESLNHFKMQIFNRWGQLLFETTNLNGRGWDGRFNDKIQPMGVYLYRIEADFKNGRQENYDGNVTLIR